MGIRRDARRLRRLLAIVVCAWTVLALAAVDDEAPARVGRIASVHGTLYRAGADAPDAWSPAGRNDPVGEGDTLRLDRDGEDDAVAEVDYGGGEFRMAAGTNVRVSRLDGHRLELFVATGRLIVRIRELDPDDSVRVDARAAQSALSRPGLYRIDVAADRRMTTLVVRQGDARLASSTGSVAVAAGHAASVSGVHGEPADVRGAAGIDAFDTWSAARDRVYDAARSDVYVSPRMIGHVDLARHGEWQATRAYGAVWFPTVDPEWAPYRFGHWTWLSRWGYTWVDDAPWGYAPFHYGRWAHVGGRWGWCPGAPVSHPAWAPALVTWSRGSVGTYGSTYGWTPLGWREPYVPPYESCSDRCYDRYNRPFAVNLGTRAPGAPAQPANGRVPGGITAISGEALRAGRPVSVNRVHVTDVTAFAPTLLGRPPAFKPGAPLRTPGVPGALPLPTASPVGSAPLRIDDGRGVLRNVPPPSAAEQGQAGRSTPHGAVPRTYPALRAIGPSPAPVSPVPASLPGSVAPPAPPPLPVVPASLPTSVASPAAPPPLPVVPASPPQPPAVVPAPVVPITAGEPARGVARGAPPIPGRPAIPR